MKYEAPESDTEYGIFGEYFGGELEIVVKALVERALSAQRFAAFEVSQGFHSGNEFFSEKVIKNHGAKDEARHGYREDLSPVLPGYEFEQGVDYHHAESEVSAPRVCQRKADYQHDGAAEEKELDEPLSTRVKEGNGQRNHHQKHGREFVLVTPQPAVALLVDERALPKNIGLIIESTPPIMRPIVAM